MSDNYQLRKDIDSLMMRIDRIAPSGSNFNIDDIDFVNTNLSVLDSNLSSFKNDLDEYVVELESFESQLGDYGDELGGFNTTLGQYESRLDDFDDALNDETDGFITALSTLKQYIYGYDPNNPSITYNNPSSDSLKGMTNTLQQLIIDLDTGDGIVLENLGRLKDYIQAFSGSLQEFKTYLSQQGVDVSSLNDDVISLILELNKSLDTISDHQDMLEEAQEIIGEPSTATTEATGMFKRLEDGEEIIDDVSIKADEIDVIVRGDPDDVTDTGLVGATSDLENKVGDNNSGLIKDTNALKNTVGDSNSGLVAQTNELVDTVGEPASGGQSATGLHLLIDNAQDSADALTSRMRTAEGNISSQGGRLTTAESNISNQGGRLTTAEGNILSQDGRLTTTEGKIGSVPNGKTLQGQINTHTGQIGDVGNVDLQTQINGIKSVIQNNNENQAIWVISDYTPSQQEWLILMYDYAIDIDNIHYAYSVINNKAFVRTRSTWQEYDIEELIGEVDFVCGINYEINGSIATVTSYETWDLMLSCRFDVFYTKQNGSWVATNTDYPYARNSVYTLTEWLSGSFNNIIVGDNKSQHRINREIDSVLGLKADSNHTHTWTSITLTNGTLYVNPSIRMCELHYSKSGVTYSVNANTWMTVETISELLDYPPLNTIYSTGSAPNAKIRIQNNGKLDVNYPTKNGVISVTGNFMWHY